MHFDSGNANASPTRAAPSCTRNGDERGRRCCDARHAVADYEGPRLHGERCERARAWLAVPWIVDGVLVYVDDVDAHFARARSMERSSFRSQKMARPLAAIAPRTSKGTAGCSCSEMNWLGTGRHHGRARSSNGCGARGDAPSRNVSASTSTFVRRRRPRFVEQRLAKPPPGCDASAIEPSGLIGTPRRHVRHSTPPWSTSNATRSSRLRRSRSARARGRSPSRASSFQKNPATTSAVGSPPACAARAQQHLVEPRGRLALLRHLVDHFEHRRRRGPTGRGRRARRGSGRSSRPGVIVSRSPRPS